MDECLYSLRYSLLLITDVFQKAPGKSRQTNLIMKILDLSSSLIFVYAAKDWAGYQIRGTSYHEQDW